VTCQFGCLIGIDAARANYDADTTILSGNRKGLVSGALSMGSDDKYRCTTSRRAFKLVGLYIRIMQAAALGAYWMTRSPLSLTKKATERAYAQLVEEV
jgi:hypothetical protein